MNMKYPDSERTQLLYIKNGPSQENPDYYKKKKTSRMKELLIDKPMQSSTRQRLNSTESLPPGMTLKSTDGKPETAKIVPDSTASSLSPFVIKSTIVASLGGILFGYDMGVVSGALPQLAVDFDLTPNQEEEVVSLLYLGGGFGAALGGYICDRMGRRYAIILTDMVFLTGATILALAPSIQMVLLGRFVVGFGVAVSGIADVAYLHEIAPPKFRGALVSCNEACISLGFLLAYIAAYFLTKKEIDENGEPFDEDINGWRYMFGIGGVFAVLQFIGMLFMPESPVWLKEQGHFEEALKVRNQIYGTSSNISSTSERIWCCRDYFSVVVGFGLMMASTGYPERYGVITGLVESERRARSIKWSANAIWLRWTRRCFLSLIV